MGNHKRRRPKHRRAGCLFCKPHKANGSGDRGGPSVERKLQDEDEHFVAQDNPLSDFFNEMIEDLSFIGVFDDEQIKMWVPALACIDPKKAMQSLAQTEKGRALLVKYDEWLAAREEE